MPFIHQIDCVEHAQQSFARKLLSKSEFEAISSKITYFQFVLHEKTTFHARWSALNLFNSVLIQVPSQPLHEGLKDRYLIFSTISFSNLLDYLQNTIQTERIPSSKVLCALDSSSLCRRSECYFLFLLTTIPY
ncbi:hypothetical protein HZS_5933 [Henneguya salminicola]|nr:hypothetical protein HZS_5933 [Henneguya salminicola]